MPLLEGFEARPIEWRAPAAWRRKMRLQQHGVSERVSGRTLLLRQLRYLSFVTCPSCTMTTRAGRCTSRSPTDDGTCLVFKDGGFEGWVGAFKSADGLINPKLVLSWILTHLGAPAYFVGLLVPIREAGALLPQLFIAGFLRSLPRRKFAWALGSLIQGLSALGMALAAFTLEGKALGLALVSLLALLALALLVSGRSAASCAATSAALVSAECASCCERTCCACRPPG